MAVVHKRLVCTDHVLRFRKVRLGFEFHSRGTHQALLTTLCFRRVQDAALLQYLR